uniref:Putative lamin n=1 Tax=Ixodes ricinus TaxID=34613 RepID=A0A0K8RER4_IXORI
MLWTGNVVTQYAMFFFLFLSNYDKCKNRDDEKNTPAKNNAGKIRFGTMPTSQNFDGQIKKDGKLQSKNMGQEGSEDKRQKE